MSGLGADRPALWNFDDLLFLGKRFQSPQGREIVVEEILTLNPQSFLLRSFRVKGAPKAHEKTQDVLGLRESESPSYGSSMGPVSVFMIEELPLSTSHKKKSVSVFGRTLCP